MLYGINDRQTIIDSQPRIDFRLYKGSKKQKGKFGQDLKDKFRLETSDDYLKKIILNNYSAELKDGSLYLSSIDILPAYNEIESTFACAMELYNASGLLQKCDRTRIYLETEEYTDAFGNKRKKLKPADKPCPIAGTLEDCPHNCNKSGHLYFYVPELLEMGLNRLGCLSVHSFSDLVGIAQKFNHYQNIFGSIKTSPFPSPQTFNLIPYKLSRSEVKIKRPIMQDGKRTGKKAEASTWAVQLEIHPIWLSQWQNHQRLDALQRLGANPSPVLLEQVYQVEPKLLESSLASQKITTQQALELKTLLQQSSWKPTTFMQVLRDMGRDRVSDLTKEEFKMIKNMIN